MVKDDHYRAWTRVAWCPHETPIARTTSGGADSEPPHPTRAMSTNSTRISECRACSGAGAPTIERRT